jgi:hypothetical protein
LAKDLDEIVAELQQRVAERRASGAYPRGLEAELEAEFDGILHSLHDDTDGEPQLEHDAQSLREAVEHLSGTAASASRVPGGALFHTVIGRLVGRHTTPIAVSTRGVGQSAAHAVDEIRRLLVAQASADERLLSGVIASVLDRLAVIDELISDVGTLERRLEALEQAASRSQ